MSVIVDRVSRSALSMTAVRGSFVLAFDTRCFEQGRYLARLVQYAHDVEPVGTFDVENEVGISPDAPHAQAGNDRGVPK